MSLNFYRECRIGCTPSYRELTRLWVNSCVVAGSHCIYPYCPKGLSHAYLWSKVTWATWKCSDPKKELRIWSKVTGSEWGRIIYLVGRGLVKAKIVWSNVGFNSEDEFLGGSFQQSILLNKISAYLAIVLILHTPSTLYLFWKTSLSSLS